MKKTILNLILMFGCVVTLTGRASAATGGLFPLFRESFHLFLGDYWCEPNRLSVVDVDADGRKDIVLMATALVTNNSVRTYNCRAVLLRAQPDGTFADTVIANFPGDYGYNIATGDLNNDGAVDFVARASQVTHVFTNDGRGGFRRIGTAPSGYYPGQLVDVNRDGLLDLVSGSQTGNGGAVMVSTNTGSDAFRTAWQSRLFGSGYDSIETVLSVNLNGDGIPDLAAREIYGGRLITFMGTTNAAAPFVEHRETYLGDRTFSLAGGRLNGDGLDDLVAHVGWGRVRVFLNQGDGSMSNYWDSPNLGQAAYNLALADFDGDGASDIFVGTFGDSVTRRGTLRIYRNVPGQGFEDWWQQPLAGTGYIGSVADVNDDGRPDLIVGEKNHLRILLNWTGRPEIERVVPSPAGVVVTWRATPGQRYQVQFKERLEDEAWTDLGEVATALDVLASVTDESAGSTSPRFYRIEQSQ